MRFALFSFVVAALSVQQVVSLPFDKRDASNDSDVPGLRYLQTLENAEKALYAQALEIFKESDFEAANLSSLVRQRFVEMGNHEQDHVDVLNAVLGENAVPPCIYNFQFSDIHAFVTLSRTFEAIGMSAYTGAMPTLHKPGNVLLTGSTLATEAQQASWVASDVFHGVPFSKEPYVTPIGQRWALTMASPFIKSCPPDANLGIQPFPLLNMTSTVSGQPIVPGGNATVQYEASSGRATYVAFLSDFSETFVLIEEGVVAVPENLSGLVYAIVTNVTSISDENIIAGPAPLALDTFANGTATS